MQSTIFQVKLIKQKQHPQVRFTYGEPLGVHELLIDTLQTRILEARCPTNDASVLLIGRGSSDPAVKSDLEKLQQDCKINMPIKQ